MFHWTKSAKTATHPRSKVKSLSIRTHSRGHTDAVLKLSKGGLAIFRLLS
jgi:hypothetical protein